MPPRQGGDPSAESSSSDDSDDDEQPKPKISASLDSLGIYAHSIKPHKHWLTQRTRLFLSSPFLTPHPPLAELSNPLNILINISESALLKLVRAPPSVATSLGLTAPILHLLNTHASRHLRRVYPRGTRFGSSNLDPVPCWRAGSHFVSMNWQGFDRGMQMNEAMFVDGCGWVVKPASMRGETRKGKTRVGVEVIGLSGREFSMYLLILGTLNTISSHIQSHILPQTPISPSASEFNSSTQTANWTGPQNPSNAKKYSNATAPMRSLTNTSNGRLIRMSWRS